jgi:tRNA(fMet)-specific endonuclease VapC
VRFALDANAVIALLKFDAGFQTWMCRHEAGDFCLSSIVAHELYFGAFKSQRRVANLADLNTLPFPVLAFDRDDARRAGEVRAHLEGEGTPIGPWDTLIAGQVIARDLTLVTRNTREFQRVPGLRLANWE